MPEIDEWSDFLPEEMRAIWPIVARSTQDLDGSLVGGTAIAIHLRHRRSFDLDFMTLDSFSGNQLARRLKAAEPTTEVLSSELDQLHAVVCGVQLQVFMAPFRGIEPGCVRDLKPRLRVDGLPVASLADLLATKLDVILYRAKLRDLVDLAAIDASGAYRLEDGLLFHMRRYGTKTTSRDLERIVAILEDPGPLGADRVFDADKSATLDYLQRRSAELREHLQRLRASAGSDPPERSTGRAPLGLVEEYRRRITPPPSSQGLDL